MIWATFWEKRGGNKIETPNRENQSAPLTFKTICGNLAKIPLSVVSAHKRTHTQTHLHKRLPQIFVPHRIASRTVYARAKQDGSGSKGDFSNP